MKILVKIFSTLLASGFLMVLAAAFYIYFVLMPELPVIDNLQDTEFQVPLRIYDKNEFLLAEYGEHRRIPVKYTEIPKKIELAFLAAEDDQFWNHHGVDPLALLAAVYELVKTGHKTRGGSTITMQVARNFFLSSEKTYSRKLNEILLALKIEKDLNKQKILELYLNKIYLGNRSYGIVAAAQVYYGKTLDELSIAQAAMIAGLPKAPSRYNPIINPERALIRRDHIIGRMGQLGYISDEEYQIARAEPVSAELHTSKVSADARYVTEMVRAEVFQKYGKEVYGSGLNVYTTIDDRLQSTANKALRTALLDYDRRHGYRGVSGKIDMTKIKQDPFEEGLVDTNKIGNLIQGVVKTVEDDKIQVMLPDYQLIEVPFVKGIDWARPYINENRRGPEVKTPAEVVKPGDIVWVEHRGEEWWLASVPAVEGAIVSLDPSSGAVLALVGGFDYFHNKFNRAVQAKRQPGSNFKPFIYSAALEKGFTAASMINDAPVVFEDDSLEATWRPENYSGRFYGPTRLREALVKSRNLVSIRILQSIGLRYATRYAQRFGFAKKDMPYDLSLALGSGAFAPLEIVRSYAVFANGGYLVKPYYINRIESRSGDILFENKPLTVCQGCEPVEQEPQDTTVSADTESTEKDVKAEDEDIIEYAPRVISPQNAYIMRSIIREVVRRGTAVRAKALGRTDIAGKTGTTNDQKDAWFSGFNDQVVTTAWVGFDNQKPLGSRETGGRAALPMWIEYMREALAGLPINLEEQPDEIVTVRIDSDTGERATKHSANSRFEIFKMGTEPAEKLVVDANTGGNDPSKGGSTQQEAIEEDIF
ncbi:MAG: penicillin-binding protein 1A [Gammaproteobacteria bacterium]|jgi:penicillin-binding protein 1A|nr:penicillin-binding protein 1A [Gammaproteobacteria bacterium]MBT3722731.1 penicillin-binding protein 1A [Gammaproteobacteria bacterium]MBT4196141.1 penicillin-binding protein 1A [Gammaproteobacteria bacterium]MBT4448629.1 penicillin-binding protein 1A [Gammaproteobacteria bacterium]MBT4860281.1 penicillin-binding protein 1A [Gammaproteobacteria bacterium]